jgi:hypothetical protein
MAFPGNVNRYVLSGPMAGGERWSAGFYSAPTPGTSAQALADAFPGLGFYTAFRNAFAALQSSAVGLDRVTVYTYGAGPQATDVGQAALTGANSAVTPSTPYQSALVLTLRTAVATRRGRGRMFFPCTRPFISVTDGLAPAAEVGTFVNATGAMLDNLAARVVSEADSTSREVIRVDADRVLDTMRSRRDRLQSSRATYVFV